MTNAGTTMYRIARKMRSTQLNIRRTPELAALLAAFRARAVEAGVAVADPTPARSGETALVALALAMGSVAPLGLFARAPRVAPRSKEKP